MRDNTPTISASDYRDSGSERAMQRAFFEWADTKGVLCYANVNGQMRSGQAMEPGLRKGVPDIYVATMRGTFGGLYLELKTRKGRLSKAQHAWIDALKREGYCVIVARSLDDAITATEQYLSMDAPERKPLGAKAEDLG